MTVVVVARGFGRRRGRVGARRALRVRLVVERRVVGRCMCGICAGGSL